MNIKPEDKNSKGSSANKGVSRDSKKKEKASDYKKIALITNEVEDLESRELTEGDENLMMPINLPDSAQKQQNVAANKDISYLIEGKVTVNHT